MEAGVIWKDLKTPLLIIFQCVADYTRMLFHTLYSFFAVFLQLLPILLYNAKQTCSHVTAIVKLPVRAITDG